MHFSQFDRRSSRGFRRASGKDAFLRGLRRILLIRVRRVAVEPKPLGPDFVQKTVFPTRALQGLRKSVVHPITQEPTPTTQNRTRRAPRSYKRDLARFVVFARVSANQVVN